MAESVLCASAAVMARVSMTASGDQLRLSRPGPCARLRAYSRSPPVTDSTPHDVQRFLQGIEKKHGLGSELVLKVRTDSGKVRRKTGTFLGFRGDEVGLRNSAWNGDKWFDLADVADAWKKGTSEG